MDGPLIGEAWGGGEVRGGANQNPFSSWQRPVLTAVLWWEADNVISGQEVSSHLCAAPAHREVNFLRWTPRGGGGTRSRPTETSSVLNSSGSSQVQSVKVCSP